MQLVVPLVAQGELIGLLNLGERLSEQEYSTEDLQLLERLAGQAAPALRVAQLVRDEEEEARLRERLEQEMRIARLIQQNFLPGSAPEPHGWSLDTYYQPAREVGGDFYDFIELGEGRIGIVIGDVTDKGVPAALVMASTRSVLRAAAARLEDPGKVLARVNSQLEPDIPESMFVTCLYGVLDPKSGQFRFANAGHNLPCLQTEDGPVEITATGMPLGMMSGTTYEESSVEIGSGRSLVLYSDALPEAHRPDGEMFGFPRVIKTIGNGSTGANLIDELLEALADFTGEGWEEEDDVTIVVVNRDAMTRGSSGQRRELMSLTVPSRSGQEREVMDLVAEAVKELSLRSGQLEQIRTAVSEAVMNAIEHGNAGRSDLDVGIRVMADAKSLLIEISDHQAGGDTVERRVEPDLEAKLTGEQSPRGWGLFLIEEMVDQLDIDETGGRRTVSLTFFLEESKDG